MCAALSLWFCAGHKVARMAERGKANLWAGCNVRSGRGLPLPWFPRSAWEPTLRPLRGHIATKRHQARSWSMRTRSRPRQKLLRLHDPQRKQPWTVHWKPRRLRPAGRVIAAPHFFVPPALTVPCERWCDCRWSTRSFCRWRSLGFRAAAGEDFPTACGNRRRRAVAPRNARYLPARDELGGAMTARRANQRLCQSSMAGAPRTRIPNLKKSRRGMAATAPRCRRSKQKGTLCRRMFHLNRFGDVNL